MVGHHQREVCRHLVEYQYLVEYLRQDEIRPVGRRYCQYRVGCRRLRPAAHQELADYHSWAERMGSCRHLDDSTDA